MGGTTKATVCADRSTSDWISSNKGPKRNAQSFLLTFTPTVLRKLAVSVVLLVGIAAHQAALGNGAPPMTVPGHFAVGPSGAATYSIAISTPPGTAGMSPVLSLDYSSQSGNGVVGLGWMLSGLESIERCPRTYDQDNVHGGVNYDVNDRFCFEGQRLVAISGTYGANGTEYRTELETFSKIVSYGSAGTGPAYFKVWTKSGQIMEFGNTTDSRALTTSGSGTARCWALNKVSDVKSNYFAVSYVNDTANGQVYPSRIDYTGNANTGLSPYNSVRFIYNTARPDVTPLYHAGSLTQTTVLLTNVQAYTGSTLVYDYRLNYELGTSTRHSRLTSVTLCDGSNNCLAPTSFGWQGTRDNLASSATASSIPASGYVFGDFNGDGLLDYIDWWNQPKPNNTNPIVASFNLHVGTGGGSFSGVMPVTATYTPGICPPLGFADCAITSAPMPLAAADHTGTGFPDLVLGQPSYIHLKPPGAPEQYISWFSVNAVINSSKNGTTFSPGPVVGQSGVGSNCCQPASSYLGDYNGDGRADYPGLTSNGDGTFTGAQAAVDANSITGDFDGDGCTDFLNLSSTSPAITYSCSPVVSSASVPNASGAKVITGDFNGDGMTDILVLPTSGSGTLYLSTGTGLTPTSFAVPTSWIGADTASLNVNSTTSHLLLAGDFNGDGKTDIAEITPNGVTFYLSTGTGFVVAATGNVTFNPNAYGSFQGQVADINDDGVPEIIVVSTVISLNYVPEYMTSVSNGIGSTTTISYDRLNKNGSFYTKCPNNPGSYVCGDAYPVRAVDGPIYVVNRVDASNGIGGTYSTTYAYAGYKTELRGRGGLGFAQVTATDLQTNIVQTTNYRQDYPYIGRGSSQTRTLGSVALSSVSNTYADNVLGGGRHFVSLTQSVAAENDLNGAAFPTTTTSYSSYDDYGNALTVNEAVSDGSSKTTTNTYSNDTTNWFLGRLTGTTVTRSVPNATGGASGVQPPTAANDNVTTNENTPVIFDPRTNDSSPSGYPLTIIATSAPSHGTVVINNGTSVTYTPASMFHDSDQFTYTISDGQGHAVSATVFMTVTYVAPPSGNFAAGTNPIAPGSSTTLNWSGVAGATSASIDNGIGNVTPVSGGSVTVSPSGTTTYALTLTGLGGTTTKQVTVSVVPTPTADSFSATSPIGIGSSSTLSWTNIQNATSASIDNGVGSITPSGSGSKPASPSVTTTYTLTLTGPTGTKTYQTTVTVIGTPSGTLTANPTTVNLGSSSSLSWSTVNTTSASINNGIGTVSPVSSGTVTVTPTATTAYVLTMTGLAGTNTASATVTIPAPTGSFSANPTAIARGGSTTLSWSSLNATSASINNGVGNVSTNGSVSVSPTTTTTYTLTLTGPSGTTSYPVTVTVYQPPTGSLTASPPTVNLGNTTTLTWSTTNATSVSIDHGIGSVSPASSGSVTVTPSATATYTLTMTGPGGTSTAQATVTMPGPSGSFSASPGSITVGGSSTLSWSSTNATTASIDNGVGNVTASSGSVNVSPGSTTIYTLTLNGPSGSTTQQTTVTVYPRASASLSANPTMIASGGSSTLSWSTSNATSASINNGVGSVSVSGGSTNVSPSSTSTYTLTAINPTGTPTTASATVAVVRAPTCSTATIVAHVLNQNPIIYGNPPGTDLRSSCSDPNGLPLTIVNAWGAAHGTLSFGSTSVVWIGTAYYSGTDSFAFTVSNGYLTTTATANVTH